MVAKKSVAGNRKEKSASGSKKKINKNISQQNKLFDRISDGIVVLDTEGTIIYINQAILDAGYDISAKDLVGKNAWKEMFRDTGPNFSEACKKAARTQKPVFIEDYYKPWNCIFRTRIYPSPEGLSIFFTDITEKINIEKKLKDNLNLIEESQEIAHLGNWYLDISNGIFQWSDEMFRIFGLLKDNSPPTIKSFLRMVYPDDREAMKTWLDQSMAGVRPGALELRITTPRGDIRWIRGDGRLVVDQKGNANRMVGFILDISERKYAEEEAQKKQKYIENIIESSPIIIFILNLKEDYPEFLPSGMKNCLGYSDAQIDAMNGLYAEALFHPDDIGTYRNIIQKKYSTLKDGEALEYEHRLKDSEGNWRHYYSKEIIFSRNPDGTPAQIIGFGLDITNRKKVESENQKERAFIEKIIDATPNIIYIYDVEQRIPIFTNLGIRKFLGYSDQEIRDMGVDLVDYIMHPDDIVRFKKEIQDAYRTLKDEDVLEFKSRLRTKDGEWRNFCSKESVFSRNSDGSVAQIFGILTNITDKIK